MTPRGMVGSKRTKWKGDLKVGRQSVQENGICPNDIVLPKDDLAVSRIHFRILYQDGFSGLMNYDQKAVTTGAQPSADQTGQLSKVDR